MPQRVPASPGCTASTGPLVTRRPSPPRQPRSSCRPGAAMPTCSARLRSCPGCGRSWPTEGSARTRCHPRPTGAAAAPMPATASPPETPSRHSTRRRRGGAMSRSRRSHQEDGPALADLEFAVTLLPLWGFPQATGISLTGEQGTNNRTFLVCCERQRYVLRVSGFLSVAEVRAEHRILRRLREGGLPFQVPEPVAAPDG